MTHLDSSTQAEDQQGELSSPRLSDDASTFDPLVAISRCLASAA
jgi:hypothetical protein